MFLNSLCDDFYIIFVVVVINVRKDNYLLPIKAEYIYNICYLSLGFLSGLTLWVVLMSLLIDILYTVEYLI